MNSLTLLYIPTPENNEELPSWCLWELRWSGERVFPKLELEWDCSPVLLLKRAGLVDIGADSVSSETTSQATSRHETGATSNSLFLCEHNAVSCKLGCSSGPSEFEAYMFGACEYLAIGCSITGHSSWKTCCSEWFWQGRPKLDSKFLHAETPEVLKLFTTSCDDVLPILTMSAIERCPFFTPVMEGWGPEEAWAESDTECLVIKDCLPLSLLK